MLRVKKYSQAAAVLAAAMWGGSLLAQAPKVNTLYSFTGASGAGPDGALVTDASGALYGVTQAGGPSNAGAVFQLTPPATQGGKWTETMLYGFTGGNDGNAPFGALVFDGNGALYGTTIFGGTSLMGTVFQLTPPAVAGGAWTETVLYNFTGVSDGGNPNGSLVFDAMGNLYGTASIGGASGNGAVFLLAPPATTGGSWTYSVLYSFLGGNDGAKPGAGVTFGAAGVVYSTTYSGGTSNAGTVFELQPPAVLGGVWTHFVLYSFKGGATDGGFPEGGLVPGAHGVLFGTTTYNGASNFGVVYVMTPPTVKGGAWTETLLYTFKGRRGVNKDGAYPFGDLLLLNNVLFGSTYSGGSANNGTLFQLKPPTVAGNPWTETVIFTFTHGLTGANPYAGLTMAPSKLVYGTTYAGGADLNGAVFQLAP